MGTPVFLLLHLVHVEVPWTRIQTLATALTQGVPFLAQQLTNPTRNPEVAGSIPGLAHWVKAVALP